jgi:hypothetical protein
LDEGEAEGCRVPTQVLQALALDEHPLTGSWLKDELEVGRVPLGTGGALGLKAHRACVEGADARQRHRGTINERPEDVDDQRCRRERGTELRAGPAPTDHEFATIATLEVFADRRPLLASNGG